MLCTDLTPELHAKCAKSWDRYNRIYSEVEAEHRGAWVREYGAEIPFSPDDCAVHREAARRVELAQLDDHA